MNFNVPSIRVITSEDYWIKRYDRNGNSGRGSYGNLAQFKANIINNFIQEHDIQTTVEFGCGDGNQLSYFVCNSYTGYDVSPVAIDLCRERFKADPTKSFHLLKDYRGERFDMALSLDVIFHLIEDEVFERHLALLFSSAKRYVIIYSSNHNGQQQNHIKHREFVSHVPTGWSQIDYIENTCGSFSDFYIFRHDS